MSKRELRSGCACCGMNRRQFLASGCAACAGAFVLPRAARAAGEGRMRLRVVYSLFNVVQPKPTWPHVGFDFTPVMEQTNAALAAAFPNVEFIPAMAGSPEEAQKILDEDKSSNITGYIVRQMNNWPKVVQTIAASGKPVVFADFTYGGSGGFLVYTAGLIRGNASNVAYIASSDMQDLIEAVKCFEIVKQGGSAADFAAAVARVRFERTAKPGDLMCVPDSVTAASSEACLSRLKASKILAVKDDKSGAADAFMDIPVLNESFAEVNEAWKAANQDEAHSIAERWQKAATSIQDVSQETLDASAAMYLGMKALLEKHGANAITINCLGGFYGGNLPAYPCLGFMELCDEGLVGACEADIRSTATMLAINAMTQGRPGYISDPVLDTSKRRIIYAHCVAPTRPFGPQGPVNTFQILTHNEDRKGASVRSILPPGYMVTTLEFSPERKEILFHQGKAMENDPDDLACRTKLVVEPVGDFEKLFTMWDQWGWHRVTAYGDLKEPVFALADAMGYKIIAEA